MTEVLGETDLDWLTLIDYELEKPCEAKQVCDKTAEWKFVVKCCGFELFFCVFHKENEIAFVANNSKNRIWCKACGFNHGADNLVEDVYDIIPV